MIQPLYMGLFMSQDTKHLFSRNTGRQINLRPDNPQNKRRSYRITQPYIIRQRSPCLQRPGPVRLCTCPHFPGLIRLSARLHFPGLIRLSAHPQRHSLPYHAAHPQAAKQRISRHHGHAHKPDNASDCRPDVERIHTCPRRRRKPLADHRIQRFIQDRNTAVNSRRRRKSDNFRADRLPAWYQAERACRKKRTQKPDRHDCPQHTTQPPWRFFQQKTHDNDRQDQPPCRKTPVEHIQENHFHFHTLTPCQLPVRYASSMIRLISAASSGVSAFSFVKAATKAGSEPAKESSTNFLLCRE